MNEINKNKQTTNILEKMAYYDKQPIAEGNQFFEFVTNHQPHDNEKLHSSTQVTGKNGEKLYHHIFVNKNTDISKDNQYDVHHILSSNKDPRQPGVAAGLAVHYNNVNVNTATGIKNVPSGGVIDGIRVADVNNRGKGYGPQIFHNMAHHHGALIGDKDYSSEGESLVNKMSKHPAYDFTPDTQQPIEEAHDPTKGTRSIFSLKDVSKTGKIPNKFLG